MCTRANCKIAVTQSHHGHPVEPQHFSELLKQYILTHMLHGHHCPTKALVETDTATNCAKSHAAACMVMWRTSPLACSPMRTCQPSDAAATIHESVNQLDKAGEVDAQQDLTQITFPCAKYCCSMLQR